MSNAKAPAWQILVSLIATALLIALAPEIALADGEDDPMGEGLASVSSAEGAMLASSLAPNGASIVSADVVLDAADPIVGSFTVDGLTYAVGSDGLTLVAADAFAVSNSAIAVPASVTYSGVAYPVTAIGSYAFYLSGATSVELPASVASVDDRAFRSSDVGRVEVDPDNPNLTSFDGALYSADLSRLLLIPEGRKGSVLLSCETEVVEASLFSHCSLVEAISVEEGGAAFSSWEGCLYDASGEALLRVPAGATDITIHDGCTTIAAGAMEGCAKLERIDAPATVTSISPDIFTSIPTVSLPAQSAMQDETNSSVASSMADQVDASTDSAPQLTAMVALSTVDDDLPEVDPSSIEVMLPEGADCGCWMHVGSSIVGYRVAEEEPVRLSEGITSKASAYDMVVVPNGHAVIAHGMRQNDETGKADIDFGKTTITNASTYTREYWRIQGTQFAAIVRTGLINSWEGWLFYGGTPGWTLLGWSQTPAGALLTDRGEVGSAITVYAQWRPNTYNIKLDVQGGSVSTASIPATYDQDATLPVPIRTGYRFLGWDTQADGNGTRHQAGAVRNLTTVDGATVTLYAQWAPAISVDVPLEVTARVDKLGIEEQTPALGYIESRCGEPIKVTDAAFEPLPDAVAMFGADTASVSLEAFADATTAPFFRFALDAAATESDPAALAPLTMASYGTRMSIAYRFDIPDDLLSSLAETSLPVCQVSYTVALA